MRKALLPLLFIALLFVLTTEITEATFEPFTGRVTRSRVRLRIQPNLTCSVAGELEENQLLIALDEEEDFYRITPPEDLSLYVYRSYVIDNVIEGTHVNVRLSPSLESPIITQLNTGDTIEGIIAEEDNKWMKIKVPSGVSLFVAKDYIENIGDKNYLTLLKERKSQSHQAANDTYNACLKELNKPFEQINIDSQQIAFDAIIEEYSDCDEEVILCHELKTIVADAYQQKRINYLENKASGKTQALTKSNQELETALKSYTERLNQLENRLKNSEEVSLTAETIKTPSLAVPITSSSSQEIIKAPQQNSWEAQELALFQQWTNKGHEDNLENFYDEQKKDAVVLIGEVKPYIHPVKNKPGDYMVFDKTTKRPIAFIYSTNLSLDDTVGKTIAIKGSPRPNNNFAYPAYFALSVE